MRSAALSAIMMVGALVFPRVIERITEAPTTRRTCRPARLSGSSVHRWAGCYLRFASSIPRSPVPRSSISSPCQENETRMLYETIRPLSKAVNGRVKEVTWSTSIVMIATCR
jgi:hypothetical protein